MKNPRVWLGIGFIVVVLGIVLPFATSIRVVIVLLGAVIVLAAVSRAVARRAGPAHDAQSPYIGTQTKTPPYGGSSGPSAGSGPVSAQLGSATVEL